MDCSDCGTSNRDDAKFCAECGTPQQRVCGSCGHDLRPAAKFCDECGTPVAAGAQPVTPVPGTDVTGSVAVPRAGQLTGPDGTSAAADGGPVRKTVTVLFCDLVGSTAFGEAVDPEAARDAMGRYFAMAETAVVAHGGVVAKFIGDGVMAMFGIPEVAEDDADRAVAAGLSLQRDFGAIQNHIRTRYGVEVGLRVGINTGEVVIADDDADIVGDALNTAARLEAACMPGRVLVGEDTWRLTRSHVTYEVLGEVSVKGKTDPIATFQVVEESMEAEDEALTPFVGRDVEVAQLRRVHDTAAAERVAKMATLIGAPGVGKTRLAGEFVRSLGSDVIAFDLRCERSGTATFAPIAEVVRLVAGIEADADPDAAVAAIEDLVPDGLSDRDRLVPLLGSFVGVSGARSTEETFFGARRLLEVLARDMPVVMVVDDIQWAEPLFLDLLDHLVEWVRDAPVTIVALARPEIRQIRPAAAETGRRVAAALSIEGLGAEATEELAARLLGADSLPADLTARLPESTEGNPLFVRELMRMLVDDGVISQVDGAWELAVDPDAIEVPPTIQSLLASRVERLPLGERRLIELASVVGSEFPRGSLAAIEPGIAADLDSTLETLRRKEIIEPTGSYWGDEPIYRFHHVLIRDAAYRRILKGSRADLHRRAGDWTERSAAGLVGEYEATIAFHFEQAHEYRTELGLLDDETTALGDRAARLLRVAAERALERDDLASAGSLALRALARLDAADPGRRGLLVVACESVLGSGDLAAAEDVLAELDAIADDARLQAWGACFHAQLIVLSRPDELSFAEASLANAAERLAELGDDAGVAKARQQRARALAALGRVGDCEAELDLALTAARAADDRRRVTAVLGSAPTAALWGPSPVPRAGGRCLDVIRLLRITTGSPAVEATSVRCQAVLEALRGRFDTARTMLETSRAAATELGLRQSLMETEYYAGLVELFAGEPAAAETHLRAAYGGLGRLGIGADAGQAAANLARSLLLQGQLDEAEDLAAEADALAGQNTQTAIAARSVMAEILSARGRHDEAVPLAREAVGLASGSDIVVDHANACAALARVCAAASDPAGADDARAEAARLYEQKGATVEVAAAPLQPTGAGVQPRPTSAADGSLAAPAEAAVGSPEGRLGDDLGDGAAGSEPDQDGAAPRGPDLPPTRATEHTRAMAAAIAAGDRDAMRSLVASDHVFESRRKGLEVGPTAGGDQFIDMLMNLSADARGVDVEFLATRGDDVCLARVSVDQHGFDYEPTLSIHQLDAEGREVRHLAFDGDDLAAATAELDRIHLESLSGGAADVWRIQLESKVAVDTNDPDRVRARFEDILAPEFVAIDHRDAGWGHHDRATFIERQASRAQTLGADFSWWSTQVHKVTAGGVVYEVAASGADGAATWSQLGFALYRDGKQTRYEGFSTDQLELALARFDELTGSAAGPLAGELTNRALVEVQRTFGLVQAHDWSGFRAGLAPDISFVDHRSGPAGGRRYRGRDHFVVNTREIAEVGLTSFGIEPLAVRGDDLVLGEMAFRTGDGLKDDRLTIFRVDRDGLVDLVVSFDPEDLAGATAELDRLYLESLPPELAAVFVVTAGQTAALNAGDWDRLTETVAADLRTADHRGMGFPPGGAADWIDRIRSIGEASAGHVTWLRQVLELTPHGLVMEIITRTTDPDSESRNIWTVAMRDGRLAVSESFRLDQREQALARLSELTPRPGDGSQSEGPVPLEIGETRATRNTRAHFEAILAGDREGVGRHLSDSHIFEPRIPELAVGVSEGGAGYVDMMMDLSAGVVDGSIEFLAARGDNLCLARVRFEQLGFPYETTVSIHEVDDDGLEIRHIAFRQEDLAAAIEALDELYEEQRSDDPVSGTQAAEAGTRAFDNAAAKLVRRLNGHYNAGETEAFKALLADDVRRYDMRGLAVHGDVEGPESLIELWTRAFELGRERVEVGDTIAVRGDRLALMVNSDVYALGDNVGYWLAEVSADGSKLEAYSNYGPDDLARAVDHLDARHLELDGDRLPDWAPVLVEFARAQRARDAEAWAATMHDDFVFVDHRALGFPDLDKQAFLDSLTVPDVPLVVVTEIHIWDAQAAAMTLTEWHPRGPTGWTPGVPMLVVTRPEEGLIGPTEAYSPDQLDEVLAAVSTTEPDRPELSDAELSNTASRTSANNMRLVDAGRADEAAAHLANGFTFEDHRRLIGREGLHDVQGTRLTMGERTTRYGNLEAVALLAVRGEHLALTQSCWVAENGDTQEWVSVDVMEPGGLLVHGKVFDPEDLRLAIEELDRLYLEGEGAEHAATLAPVLAYNAAVNRSDPGACLALLSEDLVSLDHSPMGWPEMGKDGIRERLASRDAIAGMPLGIIRRVHRVAGGVALFERELRSTTAEGVDAFDEYLVLVVIEGGLFTRIEQFPLDQVEVANERFDELTARPDRSSPHPGSLENRATRFIDRWQETCRARDWERFEALLSPNIEFVELRAGPTSGANGTRAQLVESMKAIIEVGFSEITRETIAIRGDDLALSTARWTTIDGLTQDRLMIDRVGANDTIVLAMSFDVDALPAAVAELDRLYLESLPEEHREAMAPAAAATAGINRGDLDAVFRLFAEDFVGLDHRQIGWGVLDRAGNDQRVASAIEAGYACWWSQVAAIAPNAVLARLETASAAIANQRSSWSLDVVDAGLIVRNETFAEDQFAAALARFGELAQSGDSEAGGSDEALSRFDELVRAGSQPLGGPPRLENEATRCSDRVSHLVRLGDLDDLRECIAADAVMADHARLGEGEGGREDFIAAMKSWRQVWADEPDHGSALAIRGDRLALMETRFGTEGNWSIDRVGIVQVDATGMLVYLNFYDPDDTDLAMEELDRLSTIAACTLDRMYHAFLAGEFEALDALAHPDAVSFDMRSVVGRHETGPISTAFETLAELHSLGFRLAERKVMAAAADRLILERLVLAAPDDSEIHTLTLFEVDDQGLLVFMGSFDDDDLDGAKAELNRRAGPIPAAHASGASAPDPAPRTAPDASPIENAMTPQAQRAIAAMLAGDRAALAQFIHPAIERHDRRAGVAGPTIHGREAYVDAVMGLSELGFDDLAANPVASRGDRCALVELVLRTADGAELRHYMAFEGDAGLQATRVALFDLDDRDLAIEQLDVWHLEHGAQQVTPTRASESSLPLLANAATRVNDHINELRRAGRHRESGQLFDDEIMIGSGRHLSQHEPVVSRSAAVQYMESTAEVGMGVVSTTEVIAIRGDSLAVVRELTETEGDYEVEALWLLGASPEGKLALAVIHEVEQFPEVMAELDRLWLEGEGAALAGSVEPLFTYDRAAAAGDLATARSLIADDFVAIDHSRLGWPELDADAFIAARVRAPDGVDWTRTTYTAAVWRQTPTLALRTVQGMGEVRQGSAFTNVYLVLSEVRDGSTVRAEFFEPDALADAMARFDELAAAEAPTAHAAVRAFPVEYDAGDHHDALETARGAWRWLRELSDGIDDAATASNLRRWAETMRVMTEGTIEELASLVADDFDSVDHRSASYPDMDKAQFLASVFEHKEQVPGIVMYPSAVHAASPRGLVVTAEQRGIPAEGGGERAWTIPVVVLMRGGQCTHHEYYDAGDLGAALARFHKLDRSMGDVHDDADEPATLELQTVLDNEASQRSRSTMEAILDGRVEEVRELFALDIERFDRRPGVAAPPLRGRHAYLEAVTAPIEVGFDDIECTTLATRNDRLALLDWRWTSEAGAELHFLGLTELNEALQAVRLVLFDVDDIKAAMAELDERARVLGGSDEAEPRPDESNEGMSDAQPGDQAEVAPAEADRVLTGWQQATDARDWTAIERWLGEGFVFADRRDTIGDPLTRAEFLEREHSRAQILEHLQTSRTTTHAVFGRGAVVSLSSVASQGDGLVASWDVVAVAVIAHGRLQRLEYFPAGDVDRGLDRLAQLADEDDKA